MIIQFESAQPSFSWLVKKKNPKLFYAVETLWVLTLRASELGLISSLRWDDGRNDQSVKSALLGQFCIQSAKSIHRPFKRGILKDVKQTYTEIWDTFKTKFFVLFSFASFTLLSLIPGWLLNCIFSKSSS